MAGKTTPPKTHFLKGQGEYNVAIFEEAGETMIVSAALGVCTLRYKEQMAKADARRVYADLVAEGWAPIAHSEFTHDKIWNLYR